MKEDGDEFFSSSEENLKIYKSEFFDSEHFPSGFLVLNQEEKIVDINGFGQSLIGKKKKELLNQKFSDFIFEKDIKIFQKILSKTSEGSQPQIEEIRIKKAFDSYFPSLIMIKCHLLQRVQKKFYFLSIIDFTLQKVKEEINKDSEARFENIANTAPVMIWIADVGGLFSFVNKIWLEYSGKGIGEQLGMNWLKDVHTDDVENLLNKYSDAIRTRNPFTFEFRLKSREGQYEWMMIRGTPRLSHDSIFMGFIGSCTNINVQKEFEEKIKKVNADLIEINSAKDKFFSIISHDLRSPLGGLMQILEVLEDSYDFLDEKEKFHIVTEAADASKMVYTLMENLLEWSRIQTGRIPFNPEKIELLPILRGIESLYSQNLKNKQITLTIKVEHGIFLNADIKMTDTIFRNLVSNAIKFTNPGGLILISSKSEGDWVTINVKDSGVGIEEKNLDKLFRTEVSYSTEGTGKEKGSGLGLVLCKELIEKHGGKISVESKKDYGTNFYFTLPAGA